MRPTRLPQHPAGLVLVSGQHPELTAALRSYGVKAISTRPDMRLPEPVRWHPDMQACPIGGEIFVLRGSELTGMALAHGIYVRETEAEPGGAYPKDVLCNGLAWDGHCLFNTRTIDSAILAQADKLGLKLIQVRQGYAACSTALVDGRSAITADPGVADALEAHGLEVLRVEPGYIGLSGYDYGLFGGCCGKLAPDVMAFAGQLDGHPDGTRIRDFLRRHGVKVLELMDGPLQDVGGIMVWA